MTEFSGSLDAALEAGRTPPDAPGPDLPASVPQGEEPRSLTQDAWRLLRRSKIFWFSVTLIAIFVLMAIWPSLFTSTDPRDVGPVRTRPGGAAIFGRDGQGYDIYARTVYGARASILVGILATTVVMLVGSFLGMISGFFGGWIDSIISRITDVFFAIPLILGGILFMTAFPSDQATPYLWVVGKVVIVLSILAWPNFLRLMRGSVLQIKHNEYVLAARALGAGTHRILWRHILPNALTPVLTLTTITVGVFIVAEATLSFLGIGLVPPAVSWGVAIDEALPFVYSYPHMLLFPSLFLSLCVLSFIMLGESVRDAFDPKSR
jgi:oligopeptide transport system permease protein